MLELEGGTIGLKAIATLGEAEALAADFTVEAAVTDGATEPVVIAVGQATGLSVGVVDAPARHDRRADIGLVVAIRVLEEEELGRLRNNNPPVSEGEARRDVKAVSKHRELVGLTVTIGIFTDDNLIIAGTVLRDAMRVVAGLGYPEATAIIPGKRNGLHDVRLGSKED